MGTAGIFGKFWTWETWGACETWGMPEMWFCLRVFIWSRPIILLLLFGWDCPPKNPALLAIVRLGHKDRRWLDSRKSCVFLKFHKIWILAIFVQCTGLFRAEYVLFDASWRNNYIRPLFGRKRTLNCTKIAKIQIFWKFKKTQDLRESGHLLSLWVRINPIEHIIWLSLLLLLLHHHNHRLLQ